MKLNDGKISIFTRFPIITWLGAIFCFVIFPLAVINYGISSVISRRNENVKNEVFQKMDNQLEFMLSCANDSRFYNQLLGAKFEKAKKSKTPLKSIEKSIIRLKSLYPNCFKFIVWDKNGRTVSKLTDEKGYRYIVKNLYKLFKTVSNEYYRNNNVKIQDIPIMLKKINIFRSYLGMFFVPAHLKKPLLPNKVGECILANTESRMPLFWYHYSKKLTIFCSISKNALHKMNGVISAIRNLKKDNNSFPVGYIKLNPDVEIYPKMNKKFRNEVVLEFGKFENSALPHLESKNFLLSFKLLSPDLRGFSIVRKKNFLEDINAYKARVFAGIFKLLFPIIFILYCLQLKRGKLFISIKWKMAFLFIYANALPLMILGVISSEYIEQRKIDILQQFHQSNIKLISEIDRRYQMFKERKSHDVKKKLSNFLNKNSLETKSDSNDKKLSVLLNNINAFEIDVFAQNGDILAKASRNVKNSSKLFLKMFATGMLNHANKDVDGKVKGLKLRAATSQIAVKINFKVLLGRFYRIIGKVKELFLGTNKMIAYLHLIPDISADYFRALLVIIFDPAVLQNNYVNQKLNYYYKKNNNKYMFALMVPKNELIGANIPLFFADREKIINQIQKVEHFQIIKSNNFVLSGKKYAFTGVAGRQMESTLFAIISPFDVLTEKLQKSKNYSYVFLVFNLLISVTITFLISNQFINPINELGAAIKEIGNRNFRYQTNITTNDEFSELGSVLNTTIEGMSDLEVGTVVQENLLPGNMLEDGKIHIYAKSVSMTKMGGDYYDYFSLGDGLTGIFMGDVAGHGIPAAMVTAMVKASMILQTEEKYNPEVLIHKLHSMLYRIKSKKFRRMMTCQYFVINQKTGNVMVANAGHCYPLRISKSGVDATFVELDGTPIGIFRKLNCSNSNFSIEEGDTLVLYSDGIIEAHGKGGEEFGYNRFNQLVKDAWDKDLEKYYNNIFSAYEAWAITPEDDITMVLVRYKAVEND